MISNFAFSAVQRTFDGAPFSANSAQNNFAFLGARPTQSVFQVKGMDELDFDTFYGAYTRSVSTPQSAGELRVFALGYIDHRTTVLKTDNRSTTLRSADLDNIRDCDMGIGLRPRHQHVKCWPLRFSFLGRIANRLLGKLRATKNRSRRDGRKAPR
jgi:hypothetical protein